MRNEIETREWRVKRPRGVREGGLLGTGTDHCATHTHVKGNEVFVAHAFKHLHRLPSVASMSLEQVRRPTCHLRVTSSSSVSSACWEIKAAKPRRPVQPRKPATNYRFISASPPGRKREVQSQFPLRGAVSAMKRWDTAGHLKTDVNMALTARDQE